ncbi:NUDIX domain-containing protein [Bacillus sp. cl95]|uniref:NUDIX domain-containing protein n=1 Tax=Bacillus sp. cl95 TaxID=1761761 RepID=UPI000B881D66|nr:NUDIX domain-containing protein [Bacillus sp. cl95]
MKSYIGRFKTVHIRNSAKAIIINGNNILLTKNQDDEGYFYLCPGGGQEHGETFHSTLNRECLEEIGYQVEVGELLHIREYIGKNHEYSASDLGVHQIEYYFLCTLKNELDDPAEPSNPDNLQIGIEWVSIKDLMEFRLYPKHLREYIIKYSNQEKSPVYLGDIN